jgi:molybdopterin adenylyltransferase
MARAPAAVNARPLRRWRADVMSHVMGVADHKQHAPKSVRVFVITVSDSRTEETDTSGRAAKEMIAAAGHQVAGYRVLKDEPAEVAALIRRVADEKSADVVITSGGTGISSRDSTYEAIDGLLDKRLNGFGEIFRMLSYAEIGSAAMLSRAVGGLYRGLCIFATPGSTAAVRLALEKLILPELGHLSFEVHR